MKEFTYQIQDPNGMHARPAGKLSTFAKQFPASIRVICGEKEGDAKRLLSLMALGAVHGAELHFIVSGDEEESTAQALEQYCKNSWGKGSAE